MSMGVFVFWALLNSVQKGKFPWLACMLAGMATSVRIAGVFYCLPIVWMLLQNRFQWGRIKSFILGILIIIISWYLVYPAVWKSPWQSFIGILRYAGENPWPSPTILGGKWMIPGKVPAYYAFLWMVITLPLLYLPLIFAGIVLCIKQCKRILLLQPFLLFFITAVLYLIIQSPTLYNGWRHVYFLYIPLIVFLGLTIDLIINQYNRIKISFTYFIFPLMLVINLQHDFVYFNPLKNLWKPQSFSMDYWGISTRDALLKCNVNPWEKYHDCVMPIKVYAFTETVWLNKQILGKEAFNIQDVKSADSADFVLVLNREGKIDAYKFPVFATDIYMGDTLWKIYDRRSENLYRR